MGSDGVRESSRRARSLWRNRDFMLLWAGQTVSILGGNVSGFALTLLILELTGSPARAGFITTLGAVPYLLFSLPAGALVDRWDRKRLMILCDAGRALALGSIPLALWAGRLSPLQLYGVVVVERTLFVFFNAAQASALTRVVTPAQLPAARARNEATHYGVGSLLGPALGGVLYQGLGRAVPFLADALSYGVSVVSLLFIRTAFQDVRPVGSRRLRAEIAEGLVWLWTHPLMRAMAFVAAGYVFVGAATGLTLIVAARQMHAPPTFIGVAFSIGAIGGIVGALAGGAIQRRFSFGRVIVGVTWIATLLWPLYALAPNVVVLGAITAGLYAMEPIYNVVQFGYLLPLIPDELQGRVNSVFYLIIFAGAPLGAALAGLMLQAFGVVPTVLAFGACRVVLALFVTVNPHIQRARPVPETHAPPLTT